MNSVIINLHRRITLLPYKDSTCGKNKYSCEQGVDKFKHKSNLTTHIKTVHVVRKYSCEQCDYKFTQKGNLTTHIKTVHVIRKYSCEQCDYKFTQMGNPTTHIKTEGWNFLSVAACEFATSPFKFRKLLLLSQTCIKISLD